MTQQYTEGYVPVKFVLEYRFIDGEHDHQKEFPNKQAIYVWLLGQRETDFEWVTLMDIHDNLQADSWSDVVEFCRPVKPLADLSICGDACNCMKCRIEEIPSVDEQWANSEPVIDPFDVYEPHELPPDAPKSSCIALSEPQDSMESSEWVIDPFDTYEPGELPHVPVGTLTFGELEDGEEFYVAMTWAYGSRNKLQKVMEDGEHNAVWCSATHIGELIPDGIRVIRA